MPDKYKYGFTIKHDRAWSWHIGAFFSVLVLKVFSDIERFIYSFVLVSMIFLLDC